MPDSVRALLALILLLPLGCDQGDEQPLLDDTQWLFERVELAGQAHGATLAESNVSFTVSSPCPSGTQCPIPARYLVTGRGPCNYFTGEYRSSSSDGDLQIFSLSYTKQNCEGAGITETETAFFSILETARRYRIGNGQLRISGSDGTIYLMRRN